MSHNIGIIGTGYVGLVTGTCFADTGNTVYCVDIDESKINKLKKGICPIFEPGLDRMIESNLAAERLHFTTDLQTAVENCPIIFLCLPTPPNEDGSADLQHVITVTGQIASLFHKLKPSSRLILVNKSTVPVGTAEKVREVIASVNEKLPIEVASNPEFLREGFAVEDSMKPERIVVGTSSKYVEELIRDLYAPFVRSGNPIYIMDEKSAELTKYAANSFLATKISFMNDLSAYCEAIGADIEKVRIGIGSDSRIGKRFLFAGIGYGGSCFPKDVRALIYSADQAGVPLTIVKAAQQVNQYQSNRFIKKIVDRFDGNLKDLRLALWGLAFKPNTDDVREAPAFRIIEMLLKLGASIMAYDPEAAENTKVRFKDSISYSSGMYRCLEGADALVIATEWNAFRNPDFTRVKSLLARPIIFDGRNLYNIEEVESQGIEYYCIGRQRILSK